MKTLGERIERIQTSLGMTRKQFADAVGASESSLSEWINGDSVPRIPRLVRIARLGDTTVDELLRGTVSPKTGLPIPGAAVDDAAAADLETVAQLMRRLGLSERYVLAEVSPGPEPEEFGPEEDVEWREWSAALSRRGRRVVLALMKALVESEAESGCSDESARGGTAQLRAIGTVPPGDDAPGGNPAGGR